MMRSKKKAKERSEKQAKERSKKQTKENKPGAKKSLFISHLGTWLGSLGIFLAILFFIIPIVVNRCRLNRQIEEVKSNVIQETIENINILNKKIYEADDHYRDMLTFERFAKEKLIQAKHPYYELGDRLEKDLKPFKFSQEQLLSWLEISTERPLNDCKKIYSILRKTEEREEELISFFRRNWQKFNDMKAKAYGIQAYRYLFELLILKDYPDTYKEVSKVLKNMGIEEIPKLNEPKSAKSISKLPDNLLQLFLPEFVVVGEPTAPPKKKKSKEADSR